MYKCFKVKYSFLLQFCRTSRSEFLVSVNKYLEARSHKLSVGMRFKMRFEGEEVPERRYICGAWFFFFFFFPKIFH